MHTWIGMKLIGMRDIDSARRHLEIAADCSNHPIYPRLARALLLRLEEDPEWPYLAPGQDGDGVPVKEILRSN